MEPRERILVLSSIPLLFAAIGQLRASRRMRVLAAILLVAAALFVGVDLWLGFGIWLFGVVVFLLFKGGFEPSRASAFTIVGAFLFAASLLLSRSILPGVSGDLLVGLGFVPLLVGLRSSDQARPASRSLQLCASSLSEISYTLYLFHFPVVLLIYASRYSDEQMLLGFTEFGKYVGWLLLLMAGSAVPWWLFERNTQRIRRLLPR